MTNSKKSSDNSSKSNELYAIAETSGQQFWFEVDRYYDIDRLNAKEKDNPIKGEDIIDIIEESKLTGRLKYSLLKEKYKDKVEMKTIISPTEDIPNITSRTEHNRKSKKKKRKNNGHEDS